MPALPKCCVLKDLDSRCTLQLLFRQHRMQPNLRSPCFPNLFEGELGSRVLEEKHLTIARIRALPGSAATLRREKELLNSAWSSPLLGLKVWGLRPDNLQNNWSTPLPLRITFFIQVVILIKREGELVVAFRSSCFDTHALDFEIISVQIKVEQRRPAAQPVVDERRLMPEHED